MTAYEGAALGILGTVVVITILVWFIGGSDEQ